MARRVRGHVPAGVRLRRAEVECPDGDHRPRDLAARAVLRRHWLGRRRQRRGRAGRGDPDVLGGAGRSGSAVVAVRDGGRHHRTRPGAEWTETSSRPPAPVGSLLHWRTPDPRPAALARVWVNGDSSTRPHLDRGARPRRHGRRRRLRDGEDRPRAIVRVSRHHARLERSAAGLGLPSVDLALVAKGIDAVLDGEPIDFGRLRYSVTGGIGPLGSDRAAGELTCIVVAASQPRPAASGKVTVVPWFAQQALGGRRAQDDVVCRERRRPRPCERRSRPWRRSSATRAASSASAPATSSWSSAVRC